MYNNKDYVSNFSAKHAVLYLFECEITVVKELFTIKRMKKGAETVSIIPIGSIKALFVGQNVVIHSDAFRLLSLFGTTMVIVNSSTKPTIISLPYYTNTNSNLFLRQVTIFSDDSCRFLLAKKMVEDRFDKVVPAHVSTIDALRGWEGSMMKKAYSVFMNSHNIPWVGRNSSIIDPNDKINNLISLCNNFLYGYTHVALAAVGVNAALGVLHIGNNSSFVYDVADVFKVKYIFPIVAELYHSNVDSKEYHSSIYRKMNDMKLFDLIVDYVLSLFKDER